MYMILSKGREPKKQALLEMLAEQDIQTLALAFSYAQNMQLYGVDVTLKLETATQNEEALTRAYQRGYYDAMQRINRMEEHDKER